MTKTNVAILFGGESGEHEVSLMSAASVLRAIDQSKYNLIPISINKEGLWQWIDPDKLPTSGPLSINKEAVKVTPTLINNQYVLAKHTDSKFDPIEIDVVFPVMHGPLYEDGSIQGFFELLKIPYVGSKVLGSSLGMDKDIAKKLAIAANIPTTPYLALRSQEWASNEQKLRKEIETSFGFPVFVKPANMGSSVGITKVKSIDSLSKAINDAFQYDTKILVEKSIDAREIEVAVLESMESNPPIVSAPSEIQACGTHEFYSYEAKYLDENGSKSTIPAELTVSQTQEVQALAAKVFLGLECKGLARVDFFLDKITKKFLFNEVNTLPGFTSISLYPKMMEASGYPYPKLISHLIEQALQADRIQKKIKRSINSNN
ncbi:MAG: D-alanine--D-alanine ligase [Oligoflexia bacterium]|nr:D-alanine--D-alanine ligase [Oligoflexia bacterium]